MSLYSEQEHRKTAFKTTRQSSVRNRLRRGYVSNLRTAVENSCSRIELVPKSITFGRLVVEILNAAERAVNYLITIITTVCKTDVKLHVDVTRLHHFLTGTAAAYCIPMFCDELSRHSRVVGNVTSRSIMYFNTKACYPINRNLVKYSGGNFRQ